MSEPTPPRYYPLPPAPAVALKPIPRWIWIVSVIGVIALCAAIIPVYKSLKNQIHQSDPLIAGLHAKMTQGDDAGIFAESDPAYQDQVGEKKSNAIFDNVRQQLGAPRTSTCVGQNLSTNTTEGTILTLTFSTFFDKGTGIETLKLHKVDGKYRMLGYTVHSNELKKESIPLEVRSDN